MEHLPETKSVRLLSLYTRLLSGKTLDRTGLAEEYGVTVRSIQRDIGAVRCFLSEQHLGQDVIYDRRSQGYRLANSVPKAFSNSEILAVCKILLESRSLRRDEMSPILDKFIDCCVPAESKRSVTELLANEKFHYIEPNHQKHILDGLWEIGQAIQHHRVMEIEYERMKEPRLVSRRVLPVGLMFSEFYFYLTAFLEDKTNFEDPEDLFPTIYRLDRLRSFRVLQEHFQVPYRNRFEEGEFRKRVQFMFGGKLQTVKFIYTGPSIESVLDRLPTAEILEEQSGTYTIRAEVFGKGIDMWLRSQGEYVKKVDAEYGK